MIDRAWPPILADIAPNPQTCPDCGETVFPGATICDSCGTPQSVERTCDDTRS